MTALCCLLLPVVADHVPSFLCAATSSLMACFHSGQSGRARASFSFAGGLDKSQPSLAPDCDPVARYAVGSFSHQVTLGAGLRVERRGPGAAL